MWKYNLIFTLLSVVFLGGCGEKSNKPISGASPTPEVDHAALQDEKTIPLEESENLETSEIENQASEENANLRTPISGSDDEKANAGNQEETMAPASPLFAEEGSYRSQNGVFWLNVIWLAGPEVGYHNEVSLIFGTALRTLPAQVNLTLFRPWMTVHGHPGGETKMEVRRDFEHGNIFLAKNFYPIMAGPWELLINAEVDGKSDSIAIPFKI